MFKACICSLVLWAFCVNSLVLSFYWGLCQSHPVDVLYPEQIKDLNFPTVCDVMVETLRAEDIFSGRPYMRTMTEEEFYFRDWKNNQWWKCHQDYECFTYSVAVCNSSVQYSKSVMPVLSHKCQNCQCCDYHRNQQLFWGMQQLKAAYRSNLVLPPHRNRLTQPGSWNQIFIDRILVDQQAQIANWNYSVANFRYILGLSNGGSTILVAYQAWVDPNV